MLHIHALYKYVHSLHHRNADPEPFSGISMHPGERLPGRFLFTLSYSLAVEHLYYFSNAFIPALIAPTSPFVFLWLFVHLTFSPAAGHSGYEDHFQSDQYHYLHHARFECNYGSPFSAFIDQAMGTFREHLGDSREYKGEHIAVESEAERHDWSPNGHLGFPQSLSHAVYHGSTFAAACLSWAAAVTGTLLPPKAAAAIVAVGPILMAILLHFCQRGRQSWRYPFHKERVWGSFGFFCAAGMCFCVWPVYAALTAVFSARAVPL
jgi:hypothetical protein